MDFVSVLLLISISILPLAAILFIMSFVLKEKIATSIGYACMSTSILLQIIRGTYLTWSEDKVLYPLLTITHYSYGPLFHDCLKKGTQ